MSERLPPRLPVTVLCAALGLAGLRGQTVADAAPVTGRDAELILATGVSRARMVEAVKAICACGSRVGGTRDGEKAAEWVASRLADGEIECRCVSGPDVVAWERASYSCTLVAEGAEPLPLASALPVRGSPPVMTGPTPVVAGAGAGGSEPVSGAVVFSTGSCSVARLSRWAFEGAVAVIAAATDDLASSSWAAPVHVVQSTGAPALPLPVFAVGRADATSIHEAILTGNRVEIVVMLGSSERTARPITVFGRLGPAATRRVVLAATLEAEGAGPGASDAAAVAVVLEVARVLAADWKGRDVAPLPYEIILVLNADRSLQVPIPWTPEPPAVAPVGFEIRFRRIGASKRQTIHVRYAERAPAGLRRTAEHALADHATAGGFWRSGTIREGHMQGQSPAPPPGGLPPCLEVMTTPRTWRDSPDDYGSWGEDTDRSSMILTSADVVENTVLPDPGAMERAARYALVLLERLREEKAW